jgi:hypothetical protein
MVCGSISWFERLTRLGTGKPGVRETKSSMLEVPYYRGYVFRPMACTMVG